MSNQAHRPRGSRQQSRPQRVGLTKAQPSGDTAARTPVMIRIVELPDPEGRRWRAALEILLRDLPPDDPPEDDAEPTAPRETG